MVNPDRFSMGQQANGTPQEKQEALRSLREQGYVFHKALGMVSLFHTFQFGRAADMYRLCKSLSRLLNGRTWPASDQHLVCACFKLLSAVSCKTLTASFTGTHHSCGTDSIGGSHPGLDSLAHKPRGSLPSNSSSSRTVADTNSQWGASSAANGGNPSTFDRGPDRHPKPGNRFSATPTHCIGSTMSIKFKPAGTAAPAAPATQGRAGVGWVQGLRQRRQQARQGRAITAQQMLDLPLFQELQEAMQRHQQQHRGG